MVEKSIGEDIERARALPPLPMALVPETIEYFDRLGVLCGMTPLGVFNNSRPRGHDPGYLAVYIDGELAFFCEGSHVLLDRLQGMGRFLNLISGGLEDVDR